VVAVKNTAGCGVLDRRIVGISRDLQHLEPVAQRVGTGALSLPALLCLTSA
jgi:hypothetical protein